MKKEITFEDYLKELCFKLNPTVLGDSMPDFFDNWLGELDGEDYLKWGELYGKEMYLEGKEDVLELVKLLNSK